MIIHNLIAFQNGSRFNHKLKNIIKKLTMATRDLDLLDLCWAVSEWSALGHPGDLSTESAEVMVLA